MTAAKPKPESKSPWRKGPHANTARAHASYMNYRLRGKAKTK